MDMETTPKGLDKTLDRRVAARAQRRKTLETLPGYRAEKTMPTTDGMKAYGSGLKSYVEERKIKSKVGKSWGRNQLLADMRGNLGNSLDNTSINTDGR